MSASRTISPHASSTATFDTERVPEAARIEFWNRVTTESFSEISVDAHSPQFRGVLERREFGALQLARVHSTAVTVHGGLFGHAARSADGLLLHLQDSGSSLNEQLRRSTVLRAGDLTFCDASRPYTVRCEDAVLMTVINVPSELLSRRFDDIQRFVALNIDGTRGAGALLGSFVRNVWRHCGELDSSTPKAESSMLGALLELMDLIYTDVRPQAPVQRPNALHREMGRYVEKHLTDPDLCVNSLASAFEVSCRHVHRVFAQSETTPSGYILDQRLALAARRLRETRGESITQIAFASGFNDGTTFSRAFRKRYGVTPRAYRCERSQDHAIREG